MRNKLLKPLIYLKYEKIQDFAEEVGEHPALVSRVIAGQEPGKVRKHRYAEALGCNVKDIFPEEIIIL